TRKLLNFRHRWKGAGIRAPAEASGSGEIVPSRGAGIRHLEPSDGMGIGAWNCSGAGKLWHMDIFMQLKREFPFRMGLDVIDDQWCNYLRTAPFRLEEETAVRAGQGGPLFGPGEVRGVEDDDLQFARQRCNAGQRRLEFFR